MERGLTVAPWLWGRPQGLGPGSKGVDDEQAPLAAARTAMRSRARQPAHKRGSRFDRARHRGELGEECATAREFLGATSIAQDAIMAQALQAVGEGMEEEASDALLGRQRHDHVPIPVAIIPPTEVDQPILQGHQALVADGHAMRIATQVGHHLLRRRKRGLGIDDPVLTPELIEPLLKGSARGAAAPSRPQSGASPA